MDQKQNPSSSQTQTAAAKNTAPTGVPQLLIRTMAKDIEALSKNAAPQAAAMPIPKPPNAPVIPPPPIPPAKPLSHPVPPPISSAPVTPPHTVATPPIDLPLAQEFKPAGAAPLPPITPKPPMPTPPPPKVPATITSTPPQIPTRSLLPPKLPTAAVSPAKFTLAKAGLIIGGVLIIFAAVGGWIYWRGLSPQPSATPSISQTPSRTPTPSPAQPVIPQPLFNMDSQKIVDLDDKEFDDAVLKNNIATVFREAALENAEFLNLAFISGTATEKKNETFENLLDALKIDFFSSPIAAQCPAGATCGETVILKDLFDRQNSLIPFALFAYSQTQNSSPFNEGTGEPRLGLVIGLRNSVSADTARQAIKDLEFSMPKSLKPLWLDKNVQIPEAPKFLDNTYQNIPIRYINFPEATLSVDYAVIKDKLLITTSKESMYAAIERLLTE